MQSSLAINFFRMTGETLILIIGPALTESEKDSVEKFASALIDSYLTKRGNGAANVVVNEANSRARLNDDMQKITNENVDIAESSVENTSTGSAPDETEPTTPSSS